MPPQLSAPDEALHRLEAWMRDDRRQRTISEPERGTTVVHERGGGRFEYSFDTRGDLVATSDPHGGFAAYAYDDRRRLAQVRRPAGATTYGYDAGGRLATVDDLGTLHRYTYDDDGRLARVRHGDTASATFRYDGEGRVVEASTPTVTTGYSYDEHGRLDAIEQTVDGVTLRASLRFDDGGRLAAMTLPGSATPLRFSWNAAGRPAAVALGDRVVATYAYDDERRRTTVSLPGGVVAATEADAVDGRELRRTVTRGDEVLFERECVHGEGGRIEADGLRRYGYDALGRLVEATEPSTGRAWRYCYDELDNRLSVDGPDGAAREVCDAQGRLAAIEAGGRRHRIAHDEHGRRVHDGGRGGPWTYRYDDAGRLRQVLRRGAVVARLDYDHKGRLAVARYAGRTERFLHGADDELLAVTDGHGRPERLVVRTPLGPLAEIRGAVGEGSAAFLHLDHQGTCHLVTDEAGEPSALGYCPFGTPLAGAATARFGGREWHPELRLYSYGARWYDPCSARFLTPDSYTAGPDDERLVHPLVPGERQAAARTATLAAWLQRPRLRNSHAFCGNDPVNRADPSGHWSFGGLLLGLLGAVWTLPNTIIGLLLEITCLVGEVVRWLVWLVSLGNVSWEPPGFDVAASGRLNAFALVFSGGWLGSFSSLLGITFGNVFFVYGRWRDLPYTGGPGLVYPPAYGGKVSIPRTQGLYEHELRHTNQYGWFGPFFHLGLPVWGVYLWDVILNGYYGAWLERDAREHDGLDTSGPPPVTSAPPAPAGPPAAGPLYGGYDLQRGDRDGTARYGGKARTATAGDALPGKTETPFVLKLQQDLVALGFRVVGTPDNTFGRRVEWAVRELQACTKMANVAHEPRGATGPYADRLQQAPNPQPYAGPVSGVVNRATRDVIRIWLTNRWRCPVVIGAFTVAGNQPTGVFGANENIWLHNEVTAKTARVYARDLSGYYTLPAGREATDPVVLGRHVAFDRWGGPVSEAPTHTWAESELLPEHLAGVQLAAMTAAQRSTYKVVRAVSEQECMGFFDSLNAYDNAFVSLGPCHWTLGIVFPKKIEDGELCGYLAYLRHVDPAAFTRAFEFFGVRIDQDWLDAASQPTGQRLFNKDLRKYVGWPALQREDGTFAAMGKVEEEADWFKTWHWFYRFAMAGRTIEGFRRRMWHMARVRVRDIRSAPWSAAAAVPAVPEGAGGTRPATIGDVYSSERATAMLLRWHVFRPAHIVDGNAEADRLRAALQRAAIPAAAGDPSTWTDAHQQSLIQGLRDEVTKAVKLDSLTTTIASVEAWPDWAGAKNPRGYQLDQTVGRLADTARSFHFDASDLPAAPTYA